MFFPETQLALYLGFFVPKKHVEIMLDRIAEQAEKLDGLDLVGFLRLAQKELELSGGVDFDDAAVVLIEELQLPIADAALVLDEPAEWTQTRVQSAWDEVSHKQKQPQDDHIKSGHTDGDDSLQDVEPDPVSNIEPEVGSGWDESTGLFDLDNEEEFSSARASETSSEAEGMPDGMPDLSFDDNQTESELSKRSGWIDEPIIVESKQPEPIVLDFAFGVDDDSVELDLSKQDDFTESDLDSLEPLSVPKKVYSVDSFGADDNSVVDGTDKDFRAEDTELEKEPKHQKRKGSKEKTIRSAASNVTKTDDVSVVSQSKPEDDGNGDNAVLKNLVSSKTASNESKTAITGKGIAPPSKDNASSSAKRRSKSKRKNKTKSVREPLEAERLYVSKSGFADNISKQEDFALTQTGTSEPNSIVSDLDSLLDQFEGEEVTDIGLEQPFASNSKADYVGHKPKESKKTKRTPRAFDPPTSRTRKSESRLGVNPRDEEREAPTRTRSSDGVRPEPVTQHPDVPPSVLNLIDDLQGAWITGGLRPLLPGRTTDVIGGVLDLPSPSSYSRAHLFERLRLQYQAEGKEPPSEEQLNEYVERVSEGRAGAYLNDAEVASVYVEEYDEENDTGTITSAIWIPGMAERAFRSTPWLRSDPDSLSQSVYGFGSPQKVLDDIDMSEDVTTGSLYVGDEEKEYHPIDRLHFDETLASNATNSEEVTQIPAYDNEDTFDIGHSFLDKGPDDYPEWDNDATLRESASSSDDRIESSYQIPEDSEDNDNALSEEGMYGSFSEEEEDYFDGDWAGADYGPKRKKSNRLGQAAGIIVIILGILIVASVFFYQPLVEMVTSFNLPVRADYVLYLVAAVLISGGLSLFFGSTVKKPSA